MDKKNELAIIEAAKLLGLENIWLTTSNFSTSKNVNIAELTFDKKIRHFEICLSDFELESIPETNAYSANLELNPRILYDHLLKNYDNNFMNAILMESATSFYIAGKVKTLPEGVVLAKQLIESKKTLDSLKNLIGFSNNYINQACISS